MSRWKQIPRVMIEACSPQPCARVLARRGRKLAVPCAADTHLYRHRHCQLQPLGGLKGVVSKVAVPARMGGKDAPDVGREGAREQHLGHLGRQLRLPGKKS
jgi:hypothetical protein